MAPSAALSLTLQSDKRNDNDYASVHNDIHQPFDYFDMHHPAENNYRSDRCGNRSNRELSLHQPTSQDTLMDGAQLHGIEESTTVEGKGDALLSGVSKEHETHEDSLIKQSLWQPRLEHESHPESSSSLSYMAAAKELLVRVNSITDSMKEYTRSIVVKDLSQFLKETDSILAQYYTCRDSQMNETNRLATMGLRVQTACDQMLGNYSNNNTENSYSAGHLR